MLPNSQMHVYTPKRIHVYMYVFPKICAAFNCSVGVSVSVLCNLKMTMQLCGQCTLYVCTYVYTYVHAGIFLLLQV